MTRSWLLAILLAAAPARAGERVRIAVIHTNDVHGWLLPRKAFWEKSSPERMIGGAAALGGMVRAEKLPRLLVDSGDWFQGTPEAYFSRGLVVAEAFNALGYDTVEIGNHDFDLGEQRVRELARAFKMPVLGSNIYREDDGQRPDYVTPFVIKEVAGVKVGIFGLLTTNMRNLSFERNYRGLRFRREIDEARDMVRQLKARGATVILATTHVGFCAPGSTPFEDEKLLASEVPGIDVVIGGHTHTRLWHPVRDARNGTLVVQAGSYLSQAGRVELEIDRDTGKVVSSTAALVNLWLDHFGEDPVVKGIVDRYALEVKQRLSVVLATATARMMRNSKAESAIGDWIADCERAWAKTDIAFENNGGIRSDLAPGPVTTRDFYEIMPFDNRVATETLTGALIREALEHALRGRPAGSIQSSGLRFRYDPDAPEGRRLLDVRVGGKPLRDEARYTVALPDFLAQSGDGYGALGRGEGTTVSDATIRDVLIQCAREAKVIRPARPDRMLPARKS